MSMIHYVDIEAAVSSERRLCVLSGMTIQVQRNSQNDFGCIQQLVADAVVQMVIGAAGWTTLLILAEVDESVVNGAAWNCIHVLFSL